MQYTGWWLHVAAEHHVVHRNQVVVFETDRVAHDAEVAMLRDVLARLHLHLHVVPRAEQVEVVIEGEHRPWQPGDVALGEVELDFGEAIEDARIPLDRISSAKTGVFVGVSTYEYGAAHGALAMTTLGDTTMATLAEVEKLVGGGGARVER